MTGVDSGSDLTETGVPFDDPGRGLTEWNPLSLCTVAGLADRLPSDTGDDGSERLEVPTIESMEKPILGLEAGVVVIVGEDRWSGFSSMTLKGGEVLSPFNRCWLTKSGLG